MAEQNDDEAVSLADSTSAANDGGYGTSRWQLVRQGYISFAGGRATPTVTVQ
jgi:hypothetical protein